MSQACSSPDEPKGGIRASIKRAMRGNQLPSISPWEAVERDDIVVLKEWDLYKNLGVMKNERGRNLIHAACSNAAFHSIQFLLTQFKSIIDVNEQDEGGWTALHCLANCYLLSIKGEEPLDQEKVILSAKILLEHGADPTIRTKASGNTFLHVAVEFPYTKALEDLFLLARKKGADFRARNAKGTSVLSALCGSPQISSSVYLLRFFFEHIPKEDCLLADDEGYTCAHIAAAVGNLEVIKFFHENFPKLLDFSTSLGTVYVIAVWCNRRNIVEYLERMLHSERKLANPLSSSQEGNLLVRSSKYGQSQARQLEERINVETKALIEAGKKSPAAEGKLLEKVARMLIIEKLSNNAQIEKIEQLEGKHIPWLQERMRTLLENNKRMENDLTQYWKRLLDYKDIKIAIFKAPGLQDAVAAGAEVREELVRFVANLRNDPDLLASLLITCVEQSDLVANTIIFSLFNPFEPKSQMVILKVIRQVIKYSVERSDSVGSSKDRIIEDLITSYFRAVDGYEYLSSALNVLLTDIVEQPNLKLFDPRSMMDIVPYLSPEQEKVVNQDRQRYLKMLQQELLQSLKYFPYGIRWLASQLPQIYPTRESAVDAMRRWIFGTTIAPAIFSPERYGIVDSAVLTEDRNRRNLRELATRVLAEKEFLNEYFEEFIRVEDIADHFGDLSTPEEKVDLVIPVGQLKLICSLIPPNSPLSLSSAANKLIFSAKEKKLIYLTIRSKTASAPGAIDPLRTSAKNKLRDLLCVLSQISYVGNRKVVEVLSTLPEGNSHLDKHVLMTLMFDALEALRQLPQKDKDEDFKSLLQEVYTEGKKRMMDIRIKLQNLLLMSQRYEHLIYRLEKQQSIYQQCLASIIVKSIYSISCLKDFKTRFCQQFSMIYTEHDCEWDPFLHNNEIEKCPVCFKEQQEMFSFFRAQADLVLSQEWNKTELGRDTVLSMLQRNTLEELYDNFVIPHPRDEKLTHLLNTVTLSLEDFRIDPSITLTRAQEELRAINTYKDPNEKYLCLRKCREGIIQALCGDMDPDKILPLLIYVFYLVKPAKIFTNIRYVLMFSESAGPSIGNSILGALQNLYNMLSSKLESDPSMDKRRGFVFTDSGYYDGSLLE